MKNSNCPWSPFLKLGMWPFVPIIFRMNQGGFETETMGRGSKGMDEIYHPSAWFEIRYLKIYGSWGGMKQLC